MFFRLFNSLTTRLQITTFFMSAVGIAFSYKSYITLKDKLPEVGSQLLFDLELQILIALIAQVIAWGMISLLVIKPIVTLIEIMRSLGENTFDKDIPYVDVKNQIGSFARKVKIFKSNSIRMHNLEDEKHAAQARMEEQRVELLRSLSASFNDSVHNIIQQFNISALAVKNNAEMLTRIAQDSTNQLDSLLQKSLKTSENISSVSVSAEELAHSVSNITERVSAAENATRKAVTKAASVSMVMDSLHKETDRISEVLSVINEITDQINLLALNASIEAARAGEAGKGFSVVASEVKNLADRSSEGNQQVFQFISNIAAQTKLVAGSIEEIKAGINEISTISSEVSDAVTSQDTATKNIAINIQNTELLAKESERIATAFSDVMGKISHSSTEMLTACNELNNESADMNREVYKFLAGLRQTS